MIEKGKYSSLADLPQMKPGKKPERFAGMIGEVAIKYTKREGKPSPYSCSRTFNGSTEVMVWNETYQKCNPLLVKGAVIELKAKVEQDTRTEDEPPHRRRDQGDRPGSELRRPRHARPRIERKQRPEWQQRQQRTPRHPGRRQAGAALPIVVELSRQSRHPFRDRATPPRRTDHPGERPLHLRVRTEDGRIVTMEAGGRYRVSDDFLSASGIELWLV